MLCLSGFELYSRWVPLRVITCFYKVIPEGYSSARNNNWKLGFQFSLMALIKSSENSWVQK